MITIRLVVNKILNFFRISCPECKLGKLIQNDLHYYSNGSTSNVYTCNHCNKQFI